MKKIEIHTDKAPKALGPYSQAVEYNGTIYLSGNIAIDPQTETLSGTVEDQTERILTNMKAVLEAAGSSMDNILKVTIFLNDVNDFDKVNSVYSKHFKEPYPARICVEVAKIPLNALVEIDAIAYK